MPVVDSLVVRGADRAGCVVIPILFIMGMRRSGSTLLERLLGGFASTIVIGEQRLVWKEGFAENHLCSCGRPFLSCPFYERVRDRAAEFDPAMADRRDMVMWARYMDRMRRAQEAVPLRWIPQMYVRSLRTRAFESDWHPFRRALITWYSAIHQAADEAVIVDSTKDPSYAHLLSTLPELNVGYIHLVRDSRAVAFSWTRSKVRPEITGEVVTMETMVPWRSAIDWDVKYALSTLLRVARPGRVLEMQYEAFARHPEDGLRAVERFAMELRMPQLGTLHPSVSVARYHSVSGNPIRFDPKPARVTVDDEWRRSMSPSARLLVTALTSPFLVGHHALGHRTLRARIPSAPREEAMQPSDAESQAGG